MRLVVVAVDVYVETSVGRRCAAPGRSSLFGPQERTRKTHGAPLGCCGTRGGWVGIGSRETTSTPRVANYRMARTPGKSPKGKLSE